MDTTETSEVSSAPETAPVTTDTAVESVATDTPNTWDWTEYGDRHVTVKVDGQQQSVPLKEAMDSYMRQADYTRKTQELATERQRLAQAEAIYAALEADPTSTIQSLQEALGVDLQGMAPQDDVYVDPTEQRIAVLEQQIAAQQEAARQADIDREIDTLHASYGDFDDTALLAHAVKFGIPNLEAAYAHMTYNDVLTQSQAASQKQAADDAALAAKREAALVAGGHTAPGGVVTQGAGEKVASVWDAFRLAQRMHGG